MTERSDGVSVILFRVRVIVVINEVRCRRRFLAIQFTEELRQAACARRGRERESPCVGAPFGAGAFGLCSVSNLRKTIHA